MPAYEVLTEVPEVVPGWIALIGGIVSVAGVLDESVFWSFAWFANLALLRTYLAFSDGHPGNACVSAAVSLVLGASFMLVKQTHQHGMCELHPIRLHAGYFLWLASMVLALASGATTLGRIRGMSLLAHNKKPVLIVVLLCVVYLALGMSLPIGDCALLR